jgi:hypothetical protein
MRLSRLVPLLLVLTAPAFADGPADNQPDNVRPIPPKGSPVPAADAQELRTGLAELQKEIADTTVALKGKPELLELLPDVQIYEKAVRWALDYDEMYITAQPRRDDVPVAKAHIKTGLQRAKELRDGNPSWTTATGLVVRGYKSKIDGSVQPYGLVIPPEYDFKGEKKHRLDFWWHGRYENNLELSFINERQRNRGEFTPPGAIVVHPFGRFSNANKFAGEIDTFEVLDHVKKHYRIDESRIVARGFSMGGAACWQFAVHYPALWAAAAPGAGFAETKEFLGNFQNEKVKPEWWEKKLWRMYDATEYAQNLFNVPTVAYSGENDRQKQAADIMVKYAKAAGVEFPHVIGAKEGHKYTADAKKQINAKIDPVVEKGLPKDRSEIKFTTHTLRYNRCDWLTVTGLEKHWEKATVNGTLSGKDGDREKKATVKTENVTALIIHLGSEDRIAGPLDISLDGAPFTIVSGTGKAIHADFRKIDGKWKVLEKPNSWPEDLRKSPGLQGPIDDAFMDTFLMVRPTGTPLNEKIGAWTQKEMKHAADHWRKQFRGDAPVKDDKDVSADDIANSNLILWGDPKSNAILAKMVNKLPLKEFGDTVTLLIYPNPLNPKKYVVLNSGFTYREYDYLNNARQVPKLPDYAVIDITTPPNSRFPGKVVRAGFFDERWQLQKDDGKGGE